MSNSLTVVLERYLGDYVVSGNELIFNCPFCIKRGQKTIKRKLCVNLESKKFHCFRCNIGGNSIESLIFLLTGKKQEIDSNISISRYSLCNQVDSIFSKESTEDFDGVEAILEEPFIYLADAKGSTAMSARQYLSNRGITKDDLIFYNIHYGFSGKYENTVVFPTYLNNKLVFYTARSFVNNVKIHPSKMSAPTGKGGCLYNYDHAKTLDHLIITEGVFDAISCGRNAVCMFGKKMTEKQFDLVISSDAKLVTVCLDPDAAEEASQLAKKISAYKKCNILNLQNGDANENRSCIAHKLKTESVSVNLKSLVSMKLNRKMKASCF